MDVGGFGVFAGGRTGQVFESLDVEGAVVDAVELEVLGKGGRKALERCQAGGDQLVELGCVDAGVAGVGQLLFESIGTAFSGFFFVGQVVEIGLQRVELGGKLIALGGGRLL